MIYRLVAYSFILLGIGGTVYMAIDGIESNPYEPPAMSLNAFNEQLEDSVQYVIIDVRTQAEVEQLNTPWDHVINIPLLALDKRSAELSKYKDLPIMLVCPTGDRSRQGAKILRMCGFNAYYLEHGFVE